MTALRWSVPMLFLVVGLSAGSVGCSQPSPKEAAAMALSGLPPLNSPRVLVEKSQRRLTLYDSRRVVKTYRVCTGLASGDKEREGDKRTPVGQFYICYKNPESKYTLSMGLSYPNGEDAARGMRDGLLTAEQYDAIVTAIQNHTQPPWDTPLGGEIMIHGAGADRPGTAGCVGMDDKDIIQLYQALPIGTPVEIVP